MTYIAAEDSSDRVAKVIYQSKDAKTSKTFDALDWPRQRAAGCEYPLPCAPKFPIRANPPEAEFAIMDFTQTNRVDYAKKPVPMIKFRR